LVIALFVKQTQDRSSGLNYWLVWVMDCFFMPEGEYSFSFRTIDDTLAYLCQ
jgi:hypothetical protein